MKKNFRTIVAVLLGAGLILFLNACASTKAEKDCCSTSHSVKTEKSGHTDCCNDGNSSAFDDCCEDDVKKADSLGEGCCGFLAIQEDFAVA